LSNKETFEHLGRQFVGGIVRVEEAIPNLVARLVAKLADSGTAAAFHLAQRSQRPGSNLRFVVIAATVGGACLGAVPLRVICGCDVRDVRQTPIG
jgi:hypothetical protein